MSVRRVIDREPDGTLLFGDVVGDLAGLDAQTAVVDARQGLVEIPLPLVVAARLVMPSTADELALERVTAEGLRPEQSQWIDGWLLRANGGLTARANSVAPLAQLRRPVDDALTEVRAWYAERGLPAQLQVPLEARRLLDAELGERGWSAHHRTSVLVRQVAALGQAGQDADVDATTAGASVQLGAEPDAGWLALYRPGDPHARLAAALLTRHPKVTFASASVGGRVIAIARGCVDDAWLGVSALTVEPDHRRSGHASALMRAIFDWGTAHGARRSYVQVDADNTAALALYARLGYWHHHDYHYRREPAADAVDHSRPGSIPAPYA